MITADKQIIALLTTISGSSGSGSGITALTGDVTASGSGSVAATIAAGAVTDAKLSLTTPALGTPSALVGTNITGTAASLTAGTASAVAVGGVTGLGTGVATALAINVGTAGGPVTFNGALGTPSSGTVTNLTGTASIDINGTVGATTPAAGTFTTLVAGSTTSLLLGTAGSAVGNIGFRNATSGTITVAPPTGALGTVTVTVPAATDTLVGKATTDELTNKTLTSPVINGATSSGSTSINLSGNSGTFLTPTGVNTIGGNTTIAAGKVLTMAAGTTSIAPFTLVSGTNKTTPAAGDFGEFDGAGLYFTPEATGGRTQIGAWSQYLTTADGSVSNTAAITDFFPANSSFATVTNGIYEFIFEIFFLKTTAGTMVWTITNTQTYTNIVGSLFSSAAAGIGAGNSASIGMDTTTAAAAAFAATASLNNAVDHMVVIRILAECATAGNIRLRGTPSAGTFTARRGSRYRVRRWSAATVGSFVA